MRPVELHSEKFQGKSQVCKVLNQQCLWDGFHKIISCENTCRDSYWHSSCVPGSKNVERCISHMVHCLGHTYMGLGLSTG
jgi:hypothetical protein